MLGKILLATALVFSNNEIAHSETKPKINTEWTKSTYELHEKIVSMGVRKTMSEHIINKCKLESKDPRKCIATAVSIYGNESSFGKYCKNHSCWGVVSKKYASERDAVNDWIKRYEKFWYKHNGGIFFYGDRGIMPVSRYCTSEHSSKSKIGCPNGRKHFDAFYKKLIK